MPSRSAPGAVRAVDIVLQGPGAARLQRISDPADIAALLELLQSLQARRQTEERSAVVAEPT